MRFFTCTKAVCLLLVLSLFTPLVGQWLPGPESKRIRFSGYEWIVKDSGGRRVGPGSNVFSDSAVRVDDEGLTLRIVEKDGRFYCAEVVSVANFGYGTYRFHVATNVDSLAPNLVLGMFTWSDDPGEEGTHKELDVELGRWGNPYNDIAQFVVQPYTRPENILRFPLPAHAEGSVHAFTWTPRKARFTSEVRDAVLQERVFSRRIPAADEKNVRTNARINLWITGTRVPGDGVLEVTIRSFEFLPDRN